MNLYDFSAMTGSIAKQRGLQLSSSICADRRSDTVYLSSTLLYATIHEGWLYVGLRTPTFECLAEIQVITYCCRCSQND